MRQRNTRKECVATGDVINEPVHCCVDPNGIQLETCSRNSLTSDFDAHSAYPYGVLGLTSPEHYAFVAQGCCRALLSRAG